jgi:hypothetical protein
MADFSIYSFYRGLMKADRPISVQRAFGSVFSLPQRGRVIQPSVDSAKRELRWVENYQMASTLNGLNQLCGMRMQPIQG